MAANRFRNDLLGIRAKHERQTSARKVAGATAVEAIGAGVLDGDGDKRMIFKVFVMIIGDAVDNKLWNVILVTQFIQISGKLRQGIYYGRFFLRGFCFMAYVCVSKRKIQSEAEFWWRWRLCRLLGLLNVSGLNVGGLNIGGRHRGFQRAGCHKGFGGGSGRFRESGSVRGVAFRDGRGTRFIGTALLISVIGFILGRGFRVCRYEKDAEINADGDKKANRAKQYCFPQLLRRIFRCSS